MQTLVTQPVLPQPRCLAKHCVLQPGRWVFLKEKITKNHDWIDSSSMEEATGFAGQTTSNYTKPALLLVVTWLSKAIILPSSYTSWKPRSSCKLLSRIPQRQGYIISLQSCFPNVIQHPSILSILTATPLVKATRNVLPGLF